MSLNNLVKRLQDIMRNDAGINGDAQRIEQMVWILFLKVYDAKEEIWEFYDENYTSIIPEELRWRNWAVDHKDGKALTGDALLDFVNGKLFPTLKAIAIDENTPMSQIIVRTAFEDNNNYMKDGILLRQVINVIDEIDFEEYEDRHAFGEIYETILRSLQSAGNSGEFYTPRAVTDFMVQMIKPKLGESIADFACGTGGFLTSALKVLDAQVQTVEDRTVYSNSIYGIEKKALPFLLCATNMLLHDIDNPRIIHGNSLEKNVREYKESDRFDVILMNPPYGERISTNDLLGLYQMIGERLKHAFVGNEAWVLSYREECFDQIGLKPSKKVPLFNGALECEFRKYEIFDGKYKEFKSQEGEGEEKKETEGNYDTSRPRERKEFKPRGEGEFKPRREGEFKPRREGEFKPRKEGDFKPRREEGSFTRDDRDRKPRGEFRGERDSRAPREFRGNREPRIPKKEEE